MSLTDTALVSTINRVISDQANSKDTANIFKKGLGYIIVHVTKYRVKDTLRAYYIAPDGFGIKENSSNNVYPDYYSFVNNKLVLVTIDVMREISSRQFSEESKKNIRTLVENCLKKSERAVFYDENGKIAFIDPNFRVDYIFFDVYNLYILKNKPPVLKLGEDYNN